MAKEIEYININGEAYEISKLYAKMGLTFERFVELLGRDFYCPTLSAAPTSSTLTYVDTDGSTNHFQVGQPCRWAEGSDYRIAVCKNITSSASSWYVFPGNLFELTDDSTHRLVTDTEKSTWNSKYSKPSTGIPKTDLATDVRNSLGKADTALQSYTEQYKGTVTSVIAGPGLSGGTITESGTLSLATTGKAGTFGPSADVNGSNGTTINVPQITVDDYGRVTSVTNRTYTSVDTDTNTTYSAMTASEATAGTSTSARTISAKVLHDKIVGTAVQTDGVILKLECVTAVPSPPDANTVYLVV